MQDGRNIKIQQLVQIDGATRLRRMHDKLVVAYGPQFWWPGETRYEIIVGAYLTQNTAWKSVERSLANLREAGILTFDRLREIDLQDLQTLIRPSGFATRKSQALKAFVHLLDTQFQGSLEVMATAAPAELREQLLALTGVGPETADAIRLYALGQPVPMADEYLRRIVERHGLVTPAPGRNRKGYESLVELTRNAFKNDAADSRAELFNEFHALTVAVGKMHCGKIARCTGCPLRDDPHCTDSTSDSTESPQ